MTVDFVGVFDISALGLVRSELPPKVDPSRPIVVDSTNAPDQFGLRPEQIEVLRRQIIQGSGKVGL